MPGPNPATDEPYMTLPVSAFEALGERATRAETAIALEQQRQHEMLLSLGIGWLPGDGFYETLRDYIDTLQAALKLRETFTSTPREQVAQQVET